jgi:hypothetical protein
MKKSFSIAAATVGTIIAAVSPAAASINMSNFYNTTSIIHVIIMLLALICLAWAMKILSYVRGGLMSKSWQMFVLGFGFLLIGQVVALCQNAGLFALPESFSLLVYLLMVITWLVGLYRTRKILG